MIGGMKVGYFKVKSAAPVVRLSQDKSLALPPNRKLVVSGKLRVLTLPITGLLLGLVLIGGIQIGARLSDFNLPKEQYKNVASLTLPASVSFLTPAYGALADFSSGLYDWSQDAWDSFVLNWRVFLGLESAPIILPASELPPAATAELREQIRQEILNELNAGSASSTQAFGGLVPANKPPHAVLVVPVTGSTTVDETLKKNLRQVFADQVDIKFDANGTSGIITPIFQDGRRGNDYVFVLTPTR